MKYLNILLIWGILFLVNVSCWGPIEPEDELILNDSLSVYKDNSGELFSDIDSNVVAGIPMPVFIGATSFEGIDSLTVYYINTDNSQIDSAVSMICSSFIDTILNVGQITFNRSGELCLYYGAYYADSVDVTIIDTINFFVKGNAPVLTVNDDTAYSFEVTELDTLKLSLSTVTKYFYSKTFIASVNFLPLGAIYDSSINTIICVPDTNATEVDSIKVFDSITVIVGDSSVPPVYDTVLLKISVKDSLMVSTNSKPIFRDSLPLPSYLIDEGDTLLISYLADDNDSADLVSYFITNNSLAGSATFDTVKNTITWITGINDFGSYTLTINATDGKDSVAVDVTVGVGDVNLAPNISIGNYKIGDTLFIKEGSVLNFQVGATDVNIGDSIFLNNLDSVPWSNSSIGEGSYDTVSGNFSFLPYITAVDSIDSILVLGPYLFKATDNGVPLITSEFSLFIAVIDSPIVIEKNVPVIVTQPSSVIAIEGDSVKFTIVATGSDLHYQWFCNDTALVGDTISVMTLNPIAFSDSGNTYKCNVFNSDSTVSSAQAILSVIPKKPAITTNPVGDTVQIGDNATFTIEAIGSKLAYQWYKNSLVMTGEISDTLILTNVTNADSGAVITCKVSNSGGDTTSAEAILSVTNPPSIFYDLVDTLKGSINDTLKVSFSVTDAQKIKEIKWTDGAGEHSFVPDTVKDSLFVGIDVITGGAEGEYSYNISCIDSFDVDVAAPIILKVTDDVPIFNVALPDTIYIGYGDSINLHVEVDDDGQKLNYKWKFNEYDIYYSFSDGDTTIYSPKTLPYTRGLEIVVQDDDGNLLNGNTVVIATFELTPKFCNFTFREMYSIQKWKGEWYIYANSCENPKTQGSMTTFRYLKSSDLFEWEHISGISFNSYGSVGYSEDYIFGTHINHRLGEFYYSSNGTDYDYTEAIPPVSLMGGKACEILTVENTSYLFADSGLFVLDPEDSVNWMSKVSVSPYGTNIMNIVPNCKTDSLVYFIEGGKNLYKLRENTSNPYSLVHTMNVDSVVVGDILIEDGVLWLFTSESIKCSKDYGLSWFTVTDDVPWSPSNAICYNTCLKVIKDGSSTYVFTTNIGNDIIYKYSGPLTYP